MWKTLTEILPEMGKAAEADPENWRKQFEKLWRGGDIKPMDLNISLSTLHMYRRKRREMEYTVRRPEPLLDRPKIGQRYWVPFASSSYWAFCSVWLGCDVDELRLNRGLCYATEEEAAAAAKAMVGEVE